MLALNTIQNILQGLIFYDDTCLLQIIKEIDIHDGWNFKILELDKLYLHPAIDTLTFEQLIFQCSDSNRKIDIVKGKLNTQVKTSGYLTDGFKYLFKKSYHTLTSYNDIVFKHDKNKLYFKDYVFSLLIKDLQNYIQIQQNNNNVIYQLASFPQQEININVNFNELQLQIRYNIHSGKVYSLYLQWDNNFTLHFAEGLLTINSHKNHYLAVLVLQKNSFILKEFYLEGKEINNNLLFFKQLALLNIPYISFNNFSSLQHHICQFDIGAQNTIYTYNQCL
jgi:hypothetical protein